MFDFSFGTLDTRKKYDNKDNEARHVSDLSVAFLEDSDISTPNVNPI